MNLGKVDHFGKRIENTGDNACVVVKFLIRQSGPRIRVHSVFAFMPLEISKELQVARGNKIVYIRPLPCS